MDRIGRSGSRSNAPTARFAGAGVCLLGAALALALLAGCSSSRQKLSNNNSVVDVIVYEVFRVDRNPSYYFEMVRDSHDTERFGYQRSDDPFVIDKNVDAVQKLGQAEYARLEGQAQVVVLLTDVLLEDPAALAQANAANSLTRMGLKLPQYRSRGLEERGDRFLALLQEMDRMHAAAARGRTTLAASRGRLLQILETMGNFEMSTLILAKDTLKPFYTRGYLIDQTDPALRQAIDTALTKRMAEVIRFALRAAVDAPTPFVREEAIRGLKTLVDRGGEDAVLSRLVVETNWRVQAEAVEYLGRSGSMEAVAALLPMLDHSDPTIQHKARQSLTRIAGRDLGFRRKTWTRWAHQRHPELAQRAAEENAPKDDLDEGPAVP
jgi:hypothetical protein